MVIVDHTNRRVLVVLESREKAAIVNFLRESQESGLPAHVTEVTSGMWDGDVEAAREVFGPAVTLTIDRFHVMKNLQDRLTAARREIQRDLPESEAREFKGSRWLRPPDSESSTDSETSTTRINMSGGEPPLFALSAPIRRQGFTQSPGRLDAIPDHG
ncbi:MAG: transposase [Planctomycetota bacterium]|nr:transposase [Planctomycetota bacterium]